MVINTDISLAVRCDMCGGLKVHEISIFNLNKRIDLECSCGSKNAFIKENKDGSFDIVILCFACQDEHVFKYTFKQLLKGNIVSRCIDTGMEICFIGNRESVHKLINESEKDNYNILSELGFYDYFQNFDVMMQSIEWIKKLDEQGDISCECGNDDIEIELFSDRIELKCLNCESLQIIYAENEEDLNNLLKKDNIKMYKHGFVCLDSIINNMDTKK